VGAAVSPAAAQTLDRVSATEKGSLVIFSKVDIRWDCDGKVIPDTFIDLTNDYPANVLVQMFFVNGDEPLESRHNNHSGGACNSGCERDHIGWNSIDCLIGLTANEPSYWSALSGEPKEVSPFTVLDPSANGEKPGRPADDGSGDRVLRGFVIAYAVDSTGAEIRWNHLKGDALIVNYQDGTAWEYNAYTFRASGTQGVATGTPGVLNLNGVEFDQGFDQLLVDFYAVGSYAFSRKHPCWLPVTVDTDLTLFPLDIDLRQDGEGPVTTKARFDIWNQNEFKLSGTERCITCWDQTLLSYYGTPNHFWKNNLQTDKGKARIDGLQSQVCDFDDDDDDGLPLGGDPDDIVSSATSLLGVAAKVLDFDGCDRALAGGNLFGMGNQTATIQVDVTGGPPPERMGSSTFFGNTPSVGGTATPGVQVPGRVRPVRTDAAPAE
jgi:hypothetical protein